MALWPTLAAAAIIVAGQTGSRFGVDRLLSSKPLVALGDNSYALYLWHWPVLVLALAATGVEAPNLVQGLGIVGASIVLAVLTTRFVEKPLRDWHWPQRAGLAHRRRHCCLRRPPCRTRGRLADHPHRRGKRDGGPAAGADARGRRAHPGERAARRHPEARIIPAPRRWTTTGPESTRPASGQTPPAIPSWKDAARTVPYGEVTKRIVVLGDSHSQQYLGALAPIAAARGWELVTLLMPACRFGAESETGMPNATPTTGPAPPTSWNTGRTLCSPWPSLTHEEAPFETEVPGYLEGIRPFADAGIEIVGIRDNPRFTFNMPECIQRNGPDAPECNPSLDESLVEPSPLESYRGKVDGLHLMDLSDFICAGGICPAVVGNVYVYKDDNHLSRTYVESMIPMFEQRLLAATGWTLTLSRRVGARLLTLDAGIGGLARGSNIYSILSASGSRARRYELIRPLHRPVP